LYPVDGSDLRWFGAREIPQPPAKAAVYQKTRAFGMTPNKRASTPARPRGVKVCRGSRVANRLTYNWGSGDIYQG